MAMQTMAEEEETETAFAITLSQVEAGLHFTVEANKKKQYITLNTSL